ncbi:PRD domain-containing protein [Lactobacillus halodurans]|uniref:PRD domain-containing protein n=1 Tax=Companilactobacillus halodurans TaxID=2584183 RepID=A0A5P0ZQP8_9LACO|nr:PRD domain-containing protein [Companilactobacillus halodurans]MQS76439.1 PRD domain-containing protein [Companilactobacillus halodurans]
MKIYKVLNNNAAVCKTEQDESFVVTGRGIAFGKKPGDQIEKSDKVSVYTLSNRFLNNKFQEVVSNIPIIYIEISERIISYAKRTLNKDFSDVVYITLPDHLFGAVTRYKKGIKLKNKLLFDIKRIYPREYKIGQMAVKKLETEFDLPFLPDESAFIALHFVNAELGDDVNDVQNMTEIIDGILNIVKFHFGIIFDEDSISYSRFLTHLKFFCYRMQTETTEDDSADEMLPILEKKYPNTKKCVDKIVNMLKSNYEYRVHDDERMYLMMHINRILQDSI